MKDGTDVGSLVFIFNPHQVPVAFLVVPQAAENQPYVLQNGTAMYALTLVHRMEFKIHLLISL